MNRPSRIWAILALCFLLILAALAWMTRHILTAENERLQALEQADTEERVRLTLTRMDALATQFLLAENARPPAQYQTLAANAPNLSPLLDDDSPYARLYFEIRDQKRLSSPQSPSGETRATVLITGFPEQKLARFDNEYKSLKSLLADRIGSLKQEISPIENLIQEAKRAEKGWDLPTEKTIPKKALKTKSSAHARAEEINDYQLQRSLAAKTDTAANYNDAAQVLSDRNIQNSTKTWDKLSRENLLSLGTFSPFWIGEELLIVRRVVSDQGTRTQGIWLNRRVIEAALLDSASDLFPTGFFSKIPLPNFDFQTANTAQKATFTKLNDPRVLVTLPLKFHPNSTQTPSPIGWTPLRKSLLLGWLATLLALAAALFLIRGVITLSERRASFVSSVTHELRTPLTTFRLYTEMLAEGMVSDPEKRANYLHTMLAESERLNHLIENVLAYSRLEQGSARRHLETLSPQDLAKKLQPVLQRRTSQAGAKIRVKFAENSAIWASQKLQLDATSIEQIIFNLVDNACKYGLPENTKHAEISVTFQQLNGQFSIQVSDSGSGIALREKKCLFRPFHKSAQQAAESKPGVGLGLALSRRLARAMKGELFLAKTDANGCTFILRLPAILDSTSAKR